MWKDKTWALVMAISPTRRYQINRTNNIAISKCTQNENAKFKQLKFDTKLIACKIGQEWPGKDSGHPKLKIVPDAGSPQSAERRDVRGGRIPPDESPERI